MNKFDTVILSDLHLGARNARTGPLLGFLEWVRADRLILAGDVFDKPNLSRLDHACHRVIDALATLSHKHDLVWLLGNHDPVGTCPPRWKTAIRHHMVLDVAGQPYLVCHGHTWDKAMDLPAWCIHCADAIYHLAQRLDSSHRLARRLKRGCKTFCRSVHMLQEHAAQIARQQDLRGAILGHSHVPQSSDVDGIHYLNCGCWTENPSSFVGIRDGGARAYYWDPATAALAPVTPEQDRIASPHWPNDPTSLPVPEAA